MQSKHDNKEVVIKLLKEGVDKGKLARDFHIPRSTVNLWYDLEFQRDPSSFKVPVAKPLPLEEINRTEAKICSLISEYICEGLTDEEWDNLQSSINKTLSEFTQWVQIHS